MRIEDVIADGVPGESVDVVFEVVPPKWATGKGYREAFVYMTLHRFEAVKGADVGRYREWTVLFSREPASPRMIERHGLRPANRRTWAAMVMGWAAGAGSVEMSTGRGPKRAGLLGRDPSKPGRWRFTWFDEKGPGGHSEGGEALELLERAYEDGFRKVDPGAVDRVVG